MIFFGSAVARRRFGILGAALLHCLPFAVVKPVLCVAAKAKAEKQKCQSGVEPPHSKGRRCRNAAQCESLGHRPRNRAISNRKALKGQDWGMRHHFAPLGNAVKDFDQVKRGES